MPRFHCFESGIRADDREVGLGPDESHHLLRVLRAREGDPVVVLNGCGLVLEGRLASVESRRAVIQVEEAREFERPGPALHLAVGIPKGRTVDTVVRQATELGVAGITLLNAERSEASARTLQSKEKLEKWNRVAREACKQSENSFLPGIEVAGGLSDWLSSWDRPGTHWVAHPSRKSVPDACPGPVAGQDSLWMLVGPEGGLTLDELALARGKGFQPVSLGATVLRVETACVAICALAGSLR